MTGRRFLGKTVVITGASAGIGAEAARLFAREGASLVLNARRPEPLEALGDELRGAGCDVHCVPGDVASFDDCERLIDAGRAQRFSVLVNNAGAHFRGTFMARSAREHARMVDVNLRSPIVLTRLALPYFLERGEGSFVHVASLAGKTPVPGAAVYGATKFAVRAFSLALADELRGTPLRTTLVSPGPVDTAFLMEHIDDVADVVFAQPLSTAKQIAELVVESAFDGARERALPATSSRLATLTYLVPALRRVFEPAMIARGRAVKARYRSERAR